MRGLRSRVELGGSRGPPRARSDMLVRHGLYSSYRLMICIVSKPGPWVSSEEVGVAPSRVSTCASVAELRRWPRGRSRSFCRAATFIWNRPVGFQRLTNQTLTLFLNSFCSFILARALLDTLPSVY